jgi:hypothetical protein
MTDFLPLALHVVIVVVGWQTRRILDLAGQVWIISKAIYIKIS